MVGSARRKRRSTAPRAFGSLVVLVALALAVFMTAQPALAGMLAPMSTVNQVDPLGTPGNPLKMAFVPSSDSQKVLASGQPLADLLSQQTGLSFAVSVPLVPPV